MNPMLKETKRYYGVLSTVREVLNANFDIVEKYPDDPIFITADGIQYTWKHIILEPMSEFPAFLSIIEVTPTHRYEYYLHRQGFEKIQGPYTRHQLRVELFRTKYKSVYRDPRWQVQSILKRKIKIYENQPAQ